MGKKLKIAFSINDWTYQQLELTTDEFTPEQVFEMLENGEVFTTVQEGGPLMLVKDGRFEKIGIVVSNEPGDGEYFDFELMGTWED